MSLGAYSISLAVKDIRASKEFYGGVSEVDVDSEGPGSFVIVDPDGNPILFDQHRS